MLPIPEFSSEAEEAYWWDAHPEVISDSFRQAKTEGRMHRLSETELPGATNAGIRRVCSKAYTISETSKDFRYWSHVDWLAKDNRAAISDADIVVVPYEAFRDYTGPVFPVGTAELFQYLKNGFSSSAQVEIAVDDADFKELAVHADVVTVATVLVKYLVAPVTVGLIVDFISKRLGIRFGKADVRASLIVDQSVGDHYKSVQISYDGPAATFESTVKAALGSLSFSDGPATNRPSDPSDSNALNSSL